MRFAWVTSASAGDACAARGDACAAKQRAAAEHTTLTALILLDVSCAERLMRALRGAGAYQSVGTS